MKIAFIGLGVMGYPMALHLQASDWVLKTYNRSSSKRLLWNEGNPKNPCCENIMDCVAEADMIISCVSEDKDILSIARGPEGVFAHAKPGAIWVDHSTISVQAVENLFNDGQAKNISFIDAPVSGGQRGAQDGQLTIMAGGDKMAVDTAYPILRHYAKRITYIGSSGAGQLCKMVNQICLAGLLQGLSEGMHFAKQQGLDTNKVYEALSQGAAQSWQMDNRSKNMCEDAFDFGFAIDLMRKDLGICMAQARNSNTTLPVTALVDQFYAALQRRGHGKLDTSALIKLLEMNP